MNPRMDPAAILNGPLGDWLHQQSGARRRGRWRFYLLIALGIALGLIGCAIAVLVYHRPEIVGQTAIPFPVMFAIGFVGSLLLAVPMLLFAYRTYDRLFSTVRTRINQEIASALGLDYAIEIVPGDEFRLAKQFMLVPVHHETRFEDVWQCRDPAFPWLAYRATLWSASLAEEGGSQVFTGAILYTSLPGTRNEELVVRSKDFISKYALDRFARGDKDFQAVELGSKDFASVFDVHARHSMDARNVLSGPVQNALLTLAQSHSDSSWYSRSLLAPKGLCLLIDRGNLVLTISVDKLFESVGGNPADDLDRVSRTMRQLDLLGSFVKEIRRSTEPSGQH